MQKKILQKHFPAEIHRERTVSMNKVQDLFLYNKKIDALLYAYFQDMSVPIEVGQENGKKIYQTRVWKSQLPSDEKIGQICRMSRSTVIRKKKVLKEEGFLEEYDEYWIVKNPEQAFFPVPLNTIKFFLDTASSNVVKTYIYLGQGYKYAASERRKYLFTKEQIMKVIKVSTTNKSGYEQMDNILNCLINNGFIKIQEFYNGRIPMKKLIQFNSDFIQNKSV